MADATKGIKASIPINTFFERDMMVCFLKIKHSVA
jgi:hypothetical protein